jgi:hypothetical protein
VEPYGFLGYTPAFADSAPEKSMHNVPDYRLFSPWVQDAARHYRGVIRYWEVWNEPNTNGGFIHGTAEDIADLTKMAFLGVRRVNPIGRVIGASTIRFDEHYMNRLYDAGAVDYMDVLAFHHYRWDYPPDAGILEEIQQIKRWRDTFAAGRPIWNNEWGPNLSPEEDYTRYANLVARQLILDRALGLQHTDVYTWDGHPKYRLWIGPQATPGALAYRTAARHLTNAQPFSVLAQGEDGVFAFFFRTKEGAKVPGQIILAAWVTDETGSRNLTDLPVEAKKTRLTDLMGNEDSVRIDRGKATLTLTQNPVFLEGVSLSYTRKFSRLESSPADSPPRRHPEVWLSFHYGPGTEVVALPKGKPCPIEVRIYNEGKTPVNGQLRISCKEHKIRIFPHQINFRAEPGKPTSATFTACADTGLAEGLFPLSVTGSAQELSPGKLTIQGYVAENRVEQFHMATWEMQQRLVEEKNTGQGIGVRWIDPGGYMDFAFDLQGSSRTGLAAVVDSASTSPSPCDGGNIRISASRDQKTWQVLLDQRGNRAWRKVDLRDYADTRVFIRLDNPSDKGQALVYRIKLYK